MAKYNTDSYVKILKDKYGDRFDYSMVEYTNSYHKIKLICKEHDEIIEVDPIRAIRPNVKGNFCKKCQHNAKLSPNEFLTKIQKYKDYYDLSKVNFSGSRNNVTLICKHHGDFQIKARHVSVKGIRELCPICNKLKAKSSHKNVSESEEAVFYKVLVTHIKSKTKFVKIGVTSKSTYLRYSGNTYKEFSFEVLDEVFTTGKMALELENEYKKNNIDKSFFIPPYLNFSFHPTEIFIYDDEYQLTASNVKFVRDALIQKQNGICPICKNDMVMPTLDHSHTSRHNGDGKVRGAICNSCNRFIGVVENNCARNNIDFSDLPKILITLAYYISSKNYPMLHPSEAPKRLKIKKSCYNKLAKAHKASTSKKKMPKYTGNASKQIMELFKQHNIEVEYYEQ